MATARKQTTPAKAASKTAAASPSATTGAPRKRRAYVPAVQAQQQLVETAIRLLRTRPFDQVTARLITREAGLDLSTISRNFGSMQNLFVVVCRQLGADALARGRTAVGSGSSTTALGLMLDPDLVLRSRVIAWMVGEGVETAVDEERQQTTMKFLADQLRSQVPVGERTALIWMHIMLLVTEGLAVFGDQHYLSEADFADALQLVLTLRQQLPAIERQMKWVGGAGVS